MGESQQIEFKKSLAERKEIENLSNEIYEFICICQLYANYMPTIFNKCLVRVIEGEKKCSTQILDIRTKS